jgi:hypothetical protein
MRSTGGRTKVRHGTLVPSGTPTCQRQPKKKKGHWVRVSTSCHDASRSWTHWNANNLFTQSCSHRVQPQWALGMWGTARGVLRSLCWKRHGWGRFPATCAHRAHTRVPMFTTHLADGCKLLCRPLVVEVARGEHNRGWRPICAHTDVEDGVRGRCGRPRDAQPACRRPLGDHDAAQHVAGRGARTLGQVYQHEWGAVAVGRLQERWEAWVSNTGLILQLQRP